MKTFLFSFSGSCRLAVEEIWPDGDAPTDPTIADVLAVIGKSKAIDILTDWELDPCLELEVLP